MNLQESIRADIKKLNEDITDDYKDLFYEWLSECPVQWVRNEEFDGSVTYTFHFDAED